MKTNLTISCQQSLVVSEKHLKSLFRSWCQVKINESTAPCWHKISRLKRKPIPRLKRCQNSPQNLVKRRSLSPQKRCQTTQSLFKKGVKTGRKRRKVSPPKNRQTTHPSVFQKGVKTVGKLVRRRSLPQKKPSDAIPVQKRVSKQSANSWEDAKSLALQKKSYDAIPVQKKVSKKSANSWEDAVSPQKKPNEAILVAKKGVKTVPKLVKRHKVSRPKKKANFPSKQVSTGRKISPQDAVSRPKEEADPPSKQVSTGRKISPQDAVSRPKEEANPSSKQVSMTIN